jgi:hypothetical protein
MSSVFSQKKGKNNKEKYKKDKRGKIISRSALPETYSGSSIEKHICFYCSEIVCRG